MNPRAGSIRARVIVISVALIVLAACDAYRPIVGPAMSPAGATPALTPAGCWWNANADQKETGFTSETGACIPRSSLMSVRCAQPEIVRGDGTSQTLRYVGGAFAVPLATLPLNAELLGRDAQMRVFGEPRDPRWLFVQRGATTERWLALPAGKVPAPTVTASIGPSWTYAPVSPASYAPGAAPSVFFIGDSIAHGATYALQAALPGWTTGFDAVVGRSSFAGISIAAAQGEASPGPDVVVVELGTNDADPLAFAQNATAILESLKNVPLVIWQTTHGPMSRIPEINAEIHRIVPSYPNTVIADWDTFVPPQDLSPDGVHPLAQHEDDMARLLVPILQGWVDAASGSCSKRS
jgi:hypothetical protein